MSSWSANASICTVRYSQVASQFHSYTLCLRSSHKVTFPLDGEPYSWLIFCRIDLASPACVPFGSSVRYLFSASIMLGCVSVFPVLERAEPLRNHASAFPGLAAIDLPQAA